jgi:hypothetical protein
MPKNKNENCFGIKKSAEPLKINSVYKNKKILKFTKKKENHFIKKIFYWICGIESVLDTNNVDLMENNADNQNLNISIEEEPFWSNINYLNMVFQFALSGFMWVFFNKFK